MKIKEINAFEILDSRGNPTVETIVKLEDGTVGRSMMPSGASTGSKESLELRDGDDTRFGGKGVLTACQNIKEKIFPVIRDIDVIQQRELDKRMLELDGTENKSNLGANAILAVSLAVCRASARQSKMELWEYIQNTYGFKKQEDYIFPIPMLNVINGGKHADSGLDIQEFMLVPSGISGFFERIRAGSEIYHSLANILRGNGYRIAVGDEGGFAPTLSSNEEALRIMADAIKKAGYQIGMEVNIGIDAAASEFFDKKENKYNLKQDEVSMDSRQLGSMYKEWSEKYNLELIEDPMSEFDWNGWINFQKNIGNRVTVIGDDLLVTNKRLVQTAAERKACNAVLIKVNQVGSLSETIDCILTARENSMKIAVSHRSGETSDDFISDLAVAVGAEYVKFGAPARGERVAKYNRLIEIERSWKGLS
jgi:enolase